MRRIPRPFVLLAILVGSAIAVLSSIGAPQIPGKLPGSKSRSIFAPYYTTAHGWRATLGLNNSTRAAFTVHPTVYAPDGAGIPMPAIRVEAHQHLAVDLNEWVSQLGEAYTTGSIQLDYESVGFGLGAQLSLTNEKQSLAIDVPLHSRGEFASSRLEGIWWTPDRDTRVTLGMVNTTDRTVVASLTLTSEDGRKIRRTPVPLGPHQSRALNPRELVVRADELMGGIAIKHDGGRGAVMAQAFAVDHHSGFSANLPLVDPATAGHSFLAGAGAYVGAIGSGDTAADFTGYLLLRNTSEEPAVVAPVLQQGAAQVSLTEATLAAGEVRRIIVPPSMVSPGGPPIGIQITHSGRPGGVIGQWHSVDHGGSLVVETPLRWPASRQGGGNNPWSLEGDNTSVLYVKNTGTEPATFLVNLHFAGGEYMLGLQTLEAGETKAFDIGQLRDSQQPDVHGHTLPPDLSSGQALWGWRSGPPLVGRLVVLSRRKGVASNMSCPICCLCPKTRELFLLPASSTGLAGDSVQEQTWVLERDDCGERDYPENNSSFWWASSNSAVASVNDTGLVNCLAGGWSEVSASGDLSNEEIDWSQEPIPEECPFCIGVIFAAVAAVVINVDDPPTISGGNTVWWFPGRNPSGHPTVVTLTASPAGAGSYQWTIVSGSDKVRFASFVGNEADVLATGTAFSQTLEDVSIRVRVNNQDSPLFKMTVRTPHRLTAGSTTHLSDATFGYRTFANYIIKDNLNEILPSPIAINQRWSTAVIDDFAGNNWTRGMESGVTISNSQFQDEISSGRALSQSPIPVPTAPQSPLGSTAVHHWGQEWRVGDLNPGVGRRVQVNSLQRYRDHAIHLSIASPAP